MGPTSALGQLLGKLRRTWLTHFRPRYIRAQQRRKRGSCRKCGNCCKLLHRCLFLGRDSLCRIYHLWRPASCRGFPVDAQDLRYVDGDCGFWFEDEA